MFFYPRTWNEKTNRPFNVLNTDIMSAAAADGGSVPSAISASDLALVITETNQQSLRVKDSLAGDGNGITKTAINIGVGLGRAYDLYSLLILFGHGIDDDIPQNWHLIDGYEPVLYQDQAGEFSPSQITLGNGYDGMIATKQTAFPGTAIASLDSAVRLHLGVRVGDDLQSAGAIRKIRNCVDAFGIVGTNLDVISSWDIYGSDDNLNWSRIEKSKLDTHGWQSGEIYYSSFRGSGMGCRIVKFAKTERYQFVKGYVNNQTDIDIHKIFPLNLTGEMAISIDGSVFEPIPGEWEDGNNTASTIYGYGNFIGKIGTYGSTPIAVDEYLDIPNSVSIDIDNNCIHVLDTRKRGVKLFDLDTYLCTDYYTVSGGGDSTHHFKAALIHGDYLYTLEYNNAATPKYWIDVRQKTSPYTVLTSHLWEDLTAYVVTFAGLAIDDDYIYLSVADSSGENRIVRINIADGTEDLMVSKLPDVISPRIPTLSSIYVDDGYLYGLDNDHSSITNVALVKINKTTFNPVASINYFYDDRGVLRYFGSTAGVMSVDDNSVHVMYGYSTVIPQLTPQDVMGFNKTDLSFASRKTNETGYDLAFGGRGEINGQNLYFPNGSITYMVGYIAILDIIKNRNSDTWLEFSIKDITTLFPFHNSFRYKFTPFSDDKYGYVEFKNILCFNDPSRIETKRIVSTTITDHDHSPHSATSIENELKSILGWSSTSGKLAISMPIPGEPHYAHYGNYSIILPNDGTSDNFIAAMDQIIPAGTILSLSIYCYANLYGGMVRAINDTDGQVLFSLSEMNQGEWKRMGGDVELKSDCSRIKFFVSPHDPTSITDIAPINTPTSSGSGEGQSLTGWSGGWVDSTNTYAGKLSLGVSFGTNSGNLTMWPAAYQVEADTEITLSAMVYLMGRDWGNVMAITDAGETIVPKILIPPGSWTKISATLRTTLSFRTIIFELQHGDVGTWYFDEVTLVQKTKNQRNYWFDDFSAITQDVSNNYDSLENKIYAIRSAGIGEVSEANKLISFVDQKTGPEIEAVSGIEYSVRERFEVNLSDFTPYAASDSSFQLTDLSRRINKCRYILNSQFNGLGSLANTGVTVLNGGTIFVTEKAVGATLSLGDYAIDYRSGVVYFGSTISAIPAGCEFNYWYAGEGGVALQYAGNEIENYKRFGIPTRPKTIPAITGLHDFVVRTDNTWWDEEKSRYATLIVSVYAKTTGPDIDTAHRDHVCLNYVTICNAYQALIFDFIGSFLQSLVYEADYVQTRIQMDNINVDIALTKLPYSRYNVGMAEAREDFSRISVNMAQLEERMSQFYVDYLPSISEIFRYAVNLIPIVIQKSIMGRTPSYNYDKITDSKALAVRDRKKE